MWVAIPEYRRSELSRSAWQRCMLSSIVKLGASLTGVTTIWNVTEGAWSLPPKESAPESCNFTLQWTFPFSSFPVWNSSVPLWCIVGCIANIVASSWVPRSTENVNVCSVSSWMWRGPAEILYANPGSTTSPWSSRTVIESLRSWNVGAWFTKTASIQNTCTADLFVPPLSVPPESTSVTFTIALPWASWDNWKLSWPAELIVGGIVNKELLPWISCDVTTTSNDRLCQYSMGSPSEMLYAKPSTTFTSKLFCNKIILLVASVAAKGLSDELWGPDRSVMSFKENDGGSLTYRAVTVKVSAEDMSIPPASCPPSSFKVTLNVALPWTWERSVKRRVPLRSKLGPKSGSNRSILPPVQFT